ncbi:MAG: enolase [Candidatus Berkelbacteria bacterium Licking1014_7]|uniref:Enolase n=1 Tax=Candidatus Berkelbacteria bacterium Licking1014_7 TaxID=2017147 RepID=A0A554LHV0_9BACT|nr:MAG: enolase [Candidatus Berkelbacteria bacterium Licking1014_7]
MKIEKITGKIIKDSAGFRAIASELIFCDRKFLSTVGQGRSRASAEFIQDDPWDGKAKIEGIIYQKIKGRDLDQRQLDKILFALLKNKTIGVNTCLAVSQVFAKAQSSERGQEIWQYLIDEYDLPEAKKIPIFLGVLIEGASHNNFHIKPDIQEYLIASSDLETIFLVDEFLCQALKNEKIKYERGFEGGLAIEAKDEIALNIFSQLKKRQLNFVKFGFDFAAESNNNSSLFVKKVLRQFENSIMEDPFSPSDFTQWQELKNDYPSLVVVADDPTVSDAKKIKAIAPKNVINAVIIKPNQAGTISKTFEAIKVARANNLQIIVSHRSQETDDDILADIAFAASADYFKAGNPNQKQRLVKYKRLEQIWKTRK